MTSRVTRPRCASRTSEIRGAEHIAFVTNGDKGRKIAQTHHEYMIFVLRRSLRCLKGNFIFH